MKDRPSTVQTRNEGWMRRVWDSMRLAGVGRFAAQTKFTEGHRVALNPPLELDRINGKLVLMGTNQTMKMLIQASQAESRD